MDASSGRVVPHSGNHLYVISGPCAPSHTSGSPEADEKTTYLSFADREIGNAWAQYRRSTVKHYRDGLEFGKVCCEWQNAFRAQGSRTGQGFERTLERLNIPKTTAYRWIRRYKIKMTLRVETNEVTLHPDNSAPALTLSSTHKKRFSFHLLLTPAEKERLDKNIELLGGASNVSGLFLDFVSQKVSERRPNKSAAPPRPSAKVRKA